MSENHELDLYPGGDLVSKGLLDLRDERVSEESLLVLVASKRLAELGFHVKPLPGILASHEIALYELVEARCPEGAHAVYNALVSRLVSFMNCYPQPSPPLESP